jgi:hypothetical protein
LGEAVTTPLLGTARPTAARGQTRPRARQRSGGRTRSQQRRRDRWGSAPGRPSRLAIGTRATIATDAIVQAACELEGAAHTKRRRAKAGSSSVPRRMRSSAGTTAGDQTQPREVALDARLEYAWSGHLGRVTPSDSERLSSCLRWRPAHVLTGFYEACKRRTCRRTRSGQPSRTPRPRPRCTCLANWGVGHSGSRWLPSWSVPRLAGSPHVWCRCSCGANDAVTMREPAGLVCHVVARAVAKAA